MDGENVGYNCFNCGTKFIYEEGSTSLSRTGKRVLSAFGIPESDIQLVLGSSFFNQKEESKIITLDSLQTKVNLFTPEIALPPRTYPLGVEHNEEHQVPIIEYLTRRKIDPLRVNAHFSLDPKMLRRVILPCIRDGKIIFWQARSIDQDVKPRYIAPVISKEAVMWGYDNIWRSRTAPLFVTEGIFDAEPVDGVALLGSKINDSKLEVLNRVKRPKVVVVDRDLNGGTLGQIALDLGWEVSFVHESAKDVNHSVQRFGRLFTIWNLMQNRTVPGGIRAASGVTVQSELQLKMQMALANLASKRGK